MWSGCRAARPSSASSRCVYHGMRSWPAATAMPPTRNARTTRSKIFGRDNGGGKSGKKLVRRKRRNARAAKDRLVRMLTALRRYPQRSQLTLIDRRDRHPYHRRGREPVAGNTGAATWEARSNGAARGWDAIGGGVGTRDRERAARRGFAARIGFGSAGGWGRRTDRGSARAAISSLPSVVRGNAGERRFRGEMNMI